MQVVRIRREDNLEEPKNKQTRRTYSKLANRCHHRLVLAQEGVGGPVLSTMAELGKGRGADQARMHKGTTKDKNKCML